jgi:transcriptional regulator of acetoin/glycerol metabolism
LARCDGNISAAAREAGVDRKTFYTLLKREKEPQAGE